MEGELEGPPLAGARPRYVNSGLGRVPHILSRNPTHSPAAGTSKPAPSSCLSLPRPLPGTCITALSGRRDAPHTSGRCVGGRQERWPPPNAS